MNSGDDEQERLRFLNVATLCAAVSIAHFFSHRVFAGMPLSVFRTGAMAWCFFAGFLFLANAGLALLLAFFDVSVEMDDDDERNGSV